MDVDVIFVWDLFCKFSRYFVDEKVGVVMVYIVEGSCDCNYFMWFIVIEYVIGQLFVCCVQNVGGVIVCLVGGVQLYFWVNLEVIGGCILIGIFVEDMMMIFEGQLYGCCMVFELYVVVLVEELWMIDSLWKQ